jgi:phosphoketolase
VFGQVTVRSACRPMRAALSAVTPMFPRGNQDQRNFRIFGPDETLSNLLGAVFEVTNR